MTNQPLIPDRLKQFIEERHAGIRRVEGKSQLEHLYQVATSIRAWTADPELVHVALLHDIFDPKNVVEVPEKEVVQQFLSKEAFAVLEDVLWLEKSMEAYHQSRQKGYLGELFLHSTTDIRGLLIKLAEINDSVSGMDSLNQEGRERLALDLQDVYLPMCIRLGFWELKRTFEATAFRHLNKKEHSLLETHIAAMHKIHRELLAAAGDRLQTTLKDNHLRCQVEVRWHNPPQLFKRLKELQLVDRLSKLFLEDMFSDIPALSNMVYFYIQMEHVRDCYRAIGVLHTEWKYAPNTFADYISVPKETGYSALHTRLINVIEAVQETGTVVVKGKREAAADIRIQTRSMRNLSDTGVCNPTAYACWYKHADRKQMDNGSQQTFPDPFIKRPITILVDNLLAGKPVVRHFTAFTPQGRAISFSTAATPLDFAFAVHSELGLSYSYAMVNGIRVPDRYKLQEGDVVEIITSDDARPKEEYLNLVYTRYARSQINSWLNKSPLRMGKRLLQQRLRHKGFSLNDHRIQTLLSEIAYDEFGNLEALYEAVGSHSINADQLLERVLNVRFPGTDTGLWKKVVINAGNAKGNSAPLWILIAKCCNPIPPEPISAYGSGRRVKIHSQHCRNMRDRGRIMAASWAGIGPHTLNISLELIVVDRKGFLRDMGEVFLECNINVENINATDMPHGRKKLFLHISGSDEAVTQSIRQLSELRSVVDVRATDPAQLDSKNPVFPVLQASYSPETSFLPNPYSPGKPVMDRGKFYGRKPELKRLKHNLSSSFDGPNLMIIGQRRVGKTSLLRYIEKDLFIEEKFLPVFIDLQAPFEINNENTLRYIIRTVLKKVRTSGYADLNLSQNREEQDIGLHLGSIFEQIHQSLAGRQLLLLFDEFDNLIEALEQGQLTKQFFFTLRSLMQAANGPKFVFCGSYYIPSRMERNDMAPLLSALAIHEIGPLDFEAAVQLVVEPLGKAFQLQRGVPQYIAKLTACYPYFIHDICYHLFDYIRSENRRRIHLKDVEHYITSEKWSEAMFSHLWTSKNPLHRALLSTIIENANDNGWCSIDSLYPLLSWTGSELNEEAKKQAIVDSLQELVKRGTLEKNDRNDGTRFYRVAIPLFQSWMQQS